MSRQQGSVWLVVAASLLHASLQGEFQRKLYKELLKNYNPLERPVANDSQPLTVYFSLSLLQIMDVDEKNQVLTTNIWLQMYWTDYYLQWNVSEYPGVKNVRFPDGQIWKPDILLYNRCEVPFLVHIRYHNKHFWNLKMF
uniref:Neurotransmitter-gated ion-channel ligand-binding domain-containing protein n=1 Tax=Vombatus ursinus TaxID=29139 RepID=A0A4X2LK70_VOMUR